MVCASGNQKVFAWIRGEQWIGKQIVKEKGEREKKREKRRRERERERGDRKEKFPDNDKTPIHMLSMPD